jgi:hypothetical protein
MLHRIDPFLETAVGPASLLLARIRALKERLDQERLQLAVLGQFKRGKSTASHRFARSSAGTLQIANFARAVPLGHER